MEQQVRVKRTTGYAHITWRRIRGTDKPEPRFVEREMILRLFAFANRLSEYRGKLKSFLNDYMGKDAPRGANIESQAKMFR
jgi:hypothetical protein